MNVRTASFRDLARIEQIYADAMTTSDESAQLHTDHPVPQARALLRLWYAVSKTLSTLVPLTEGGDVLLVAEHPQEGLCGFIQAQPAPGKPVAWQIVNLCTSTTPVGAAAAAPLVTGLCRAGQEAGVNRFHVRLPLDHPLIGGFIEQGFTQYATEQILFSDTELRGGGTIAMRSARRDDAAAIHLLYLRVTPATVAAIEAPNRKLWEATFGGGIIARMGRDDVTHFVAENPGLYAWAGVRPATAARPTVLHVMCDAQNAGEREAFIDALIPHLPEGPVSCVLRHYDSELIRTLQSRGFAVYGTQVLLSKDLAMKVRVPARARETRKKPVLVPAGLARSVPTAQPLRVPLHVVPGVTRGGAGRSERSPSR